MNKHPLHNGTLNEVFVAVDPYVRQEAGWHIVHNTG